MNFEQEGTGTQALTANEQLDTNGVINTVPGASGEGAHEGGQILEVNPDAEAIAHQKILNGMAEASMASAHAVMALEADNSARAAQEAARASNPPSLNN